MWLLWNVLVFNVWLPEGEREKWRGWGKGTGPLNSLKVTSAEEEELETVRWCAAALAACIFVHIFVIRSSQKSEQWSPISWRTGSFLLTLAVCRLLQQQVRSCLPCGWGWGSCYYAKSLRLTKINHSLPSNPSPGSYNSLVESRVLK